jgi:hypothetical protein
MRPLLPCTHCPHLGGAMSKAAIQQVECCDYTIAPSTCSWTHEVCRIWGSHAPRPSSIDGKKTICCFCGTDNQPSGIVKCAARSCHVIFHPMCALLVSQLSVSQNMGKPANSDGKVGDLPFRPSFRLLSAGADDDGDKVEDSELMPAIFCAWHSHSGKGSLYHSCPPGPTKLGKMMLPTNNGFCGVNVPPYLLSEVQQELL